MSPEKKIENEILGFLRFIGIYCWKTDRQGTYDPVKQTFRRNNNPYKIKGVSDILGIIEGGRFLAIEVKSKNGVVSPEQRAFIVSINEEGGVAFVSRSLEQTINQLLAFFPTNKKLKVIAKEYLDSKGAEH